MKPTPRIIKAFDPQDLMSQVEASLATGEDLCAPLFVSAEGLLCQRVVSSLCIYEYRLIVAGELDSLELAEQNLTSLGYDYIFDTVMWNGSYLQWMHRMNSAGMTVRDAVVKLGAGLAAEIFMNASPEEEQELVEDVRDALADGRHPVATLPFPLRLS